MLGWPGFWDKTPVDLTYCISSSPLLAFWMVLKYIFGVFVLLGEDGFRFIVLVRDVSFGRVMLLYLSCILPRYSPRIHKTSPSLVSRCVLAGGKSVLSSFCRVACTANCILYNCRFLNQNAQQAPLNAAQESLSINPEKSTCTHADGLKESLPVVQQSCGNFRNHDVLCPYSISSFEIYTGAVPSFNRDQSPTFQSIRSFGWSLFSRIFKGERLQGGHLLFFQMLLALRISQDMHYYKDGAVRVKRQVVLILDSIRQGGCSRVVLGGLS